MAFKNINTLSNEEKISFINSFDTVFSDCDGVLWLGSKVIPGAPDVINAFKKNKKSVYYLTNNSLKTPNDLSEKFNGMGFHSSREEILCTALLTAEYLKMNNLTGKVYLVASKAVKSEIESMDIETIGYGSDVYSDCKDDVQDPEKGLDPEVTSVVVGYDVHFSYNKLSKATSYITSRCCKFLATNIDEKYPMPGGRLIPGAGCFVKAIETASGQAPTVIGKPSTIAFEYVKQKKDIDPKRTLMIGDKCTTDIDFGKKCGMQTLLVLTGVNSKEDVIGFQNEGNHDLVPDYYADSIADLQELIKMGDKL